MLCMSTQILDFATVMGQIQTPEWLQYFCCIYFVTAPFGYGLIRALEPAVLATLKKEWCRGPQAGSESSSSLGGEDALADELSGFLTSSLNVELVYVILTGILNTVAKEDLESWKNGQIPSSGGSDFSLRTNIENIKIVDPKKWEDVRQQDFIMDDNFDFETNIDEFRDDIEGQEKETLTINKEVIVDAYFVHGFAKLRAQDGITHEAIEYSLCQKRNRSNVFKAGEASGASGSFFFFTHDKMFVIKTMTSTEREFFFSRFGKNYFKYFETHPNSYIARIYGIYTVKMAGHAPIHLMMLAHTLKIPSMDKV
jgi:hypothetical protein